MWVVFALILGSAGALAAGVIAVGLRPWRKFGIRLRSLGRDTGIRVDTTPGRPQAFGFDTAWLAIRTRDTLKVVEELGLSQVQRASWRGGLAATFDEQLTDSFVFVTPPVEGWTFVVGYALPHPGANRTADCCMPLLEHLGAKWSDVQYFYACPSIDLFAWARMRDGKLVRSFKSDEDAAIWTRGTATPEEREVGLAPAELRAGAVKRTVRRTAEPPSEANILALAGKWSLDPSELSEVETLPSLGFIGRAPANWRRAAPEAVNPPPSGPGAGTRETSLCLSKRR
jgi:hypothetical protein